MYVVNDSGATHCGEAFFEIKSFQPNRTRYNHNNTNINPADRRAKEVVQQYSRKFQKLDQNYAEEVVGDGRNGTVGPFEAAQSQFIGEQVIPVVVGAFGEVNKDFEKLLRTMAKLASSGEDGMSISPLRNLDKKGGAFAIMHHQFRRAVGVTTVRDMANHKLSRLHYVRATAADAKNTVLKRITVTTEDGIVGNREEADGILSIPQEVMLIMSSSVMETTLVHFKSVPQVIFICELRFADLLDLKK